MIFASSHLAQPAVYYIAIISLLITQIIPNACCSSANPKSPLDPLNSTQNNNQQIFQVVVDMGENPVLLPLVVYLWDLNVPSGPDLAISRTAPQSTVSPGDPIDYTLTFQNLGPQDAFGVVVTEFLPANTTISPETLAARDDEEVVVYCHPVEAGLAQ